MSTLSSRFLIYIFSYFIIIIIHI